MALINNATREITAKVVYYGPGLGGKTTNLRYIYDTLPAEGKGKMISLQTETDRTLFFDFLPIELGRIKDFKTRVQLYTVPGQVFYDSTRKLVLQGVDGVVFVADSQVEMAQSNIESMENLRTNLAEKKINLDEIPIVIQYNKRDLQNLLPVEVLEAQLNTLNRPSFEASALRGDGVHDTFRAICKKVLEGLSGRFVQLERDDAGPRLRKYEPPPEEQVEFKEFEPVENEVQLEEEPEDLSAATISLSSPLEEDLEPESARQLTEQALRETLPVEEESFPMEPAPASPRAPVRRSLPEEEFLSLSDLEEIEEEPALTIEEEIPGDLGAVTLLEPVPIPEPMPVLERPIPPPEPIAEQELITSPELMPEPEPIAEAAPVAAEPMLVPEPPAETPALRAEPEPIEELAGPLDLGAAEPPQPRVPAAEVPEIVVPINLASIQPEVTPEGIEIRFTIRLIYKK